MTKIRHGGLLERKTFRGGVATMLLKIKGVKTAQK
jgi:hypothetical protein